MKTVRVTWKREVKAYGRSFAGCLPLAAFLGVCGWHFAFLLRTFEGGFLQIQTLWGMAIAPWLPILAALLTMRLFAAERATGMMDLLLAAPIRERDVVMGKFLAALSIVFVLLLILLALPLFVLPMMTPHMEAQLHGVAFLPTLGILLLQASVWCAAGTMVSSFFRHQASAAVASLLLCVGMPVAVYGALLVWVPSMRAGMAWMPFLVHVYDFSTGLFSTGVVLMYVLLTSFMLFACSKGMACLRLRGGR